MSMSNYAVPSQDELDLSNDWLAIYKASVEIIELDGVSRLVTKSLVGKEGFALSIGCTKKGLLALLSVIKIRQADDRELPISLE